MVFRAQGVEDNRGSVGFGKWVWVHSLEPTVDSANNEAHWLENGRTDEYEERSKTVGDGKLITVCLGKEPHLDVLVGLTMQDGSCIQVSGPYDTGSQISFVDEALIRRFMPNLLDLVEKIST